MSSSRQDDVRNPDTSGGEEDDNDSEDDEQYPPWLADVARECPYTVQVLEEEAEEHRSGYIRCKLVELPDAADCARGNAPRKYKLQRYSTVLVLAGPDEPPYIALVDKIWRKAAAAPAGDQHGTYQAVDFQVECYWFYRRSELPSVAWTALRRTAHMPSSIMGARYSNSSKEKPFVEQDSPRQVLFSSHHTQHDVDASGPPGINMSAVLQTCKVHWLGPRDKPPERYTIHRSRLICTREPGFVVQGFLWCNNRAKAQFAAQYKRAFPLDGSWNDAETAKIVDVMRNKYLRVAASLKERNRRVIEKYRQHKLVQQRGAISSDDGEVAQMHIKGQRHNLQQQAAACQGQLSQQQHQPETAAIAYSSRDSGGELALEHKMKALGHGPHATEQQQQGRQGLLMKPRAVPVKVESSSDSDDNITLVRRMRLMGTTKQQPPRRQQRPPHQDLHRQDDQQQTQALA